jgi:ABC-type uncharacterized transport system permease subunit
VRLDWEIAKRGWRRYAAYPWATAAGVLTNTVFGFIQAYILLAVFRHRPQVGDYDASDAVTYVWLAQTLIMTVFIFGWNELALRIRDGSIASDLARPWTRSATGSPSTSAARRTTSSSAASPVSDRGARVRAALPVTRQCGGVHRSGSRRDG